MARSISITKRRSTTRSTRCKRLSEKREFEGLPLKNLSPTQIAKETTTFSERF
jgi:hypothetical protein